MNTAERLSQFYPFDESVIESISEVAERQRGQSFDALADEFGLKVQPYLSWPDHGDHGIQYWYIDRDPKADIDRSKVRVYHTPMANPANKNMAMRAIRLYAVDPTVPLMVVGNPAGIRRGGAKVPKTERPALRDGDFSALARPLLSDLVHKEVDRIETIGVSFGADLAAETAITAPEFGIVAEKSICIEPTSVAMRGGARLAVDFWKSGKKLDHYVEASESKALIEAREEDAKDISFVNWGFGLLTPTSRGIARGIAKGVFAQRVRRALDMNQELGMTVAWGTQSEMSTPVKLNLLMQKMMREYPDRLHAMELHGMHHAGCDDIDLHAAIVLQGLKEATS